MLLSVSVFVFSVLLGWLLGQAMILVSQRIGLKDIPNHRSSHSTPVPRGGGIAIVVPSLLGVIALYFLHRPQGLVLWPLAVGGFMVALVGWIDDLKNLSAKTRFFVHILATAVLLGSQYDYLGLSLFSGFPASVPLNIVLLTLFVLWMTNLYNFMDGIDGLAAGQAVTVGITVATILFLLDYADGVIYIVSIILGGSALGFLFLNWSPAKIFMGDVGSGFMGFWIAGLTVLGVIRFHLSPIIFLVPMLVFIVDTTFTLIRRLLSRADLTEPHLSHAYHILIRRGHSHSFVSGRVMVFNFVILAPLTFLLVYNGKGDSLSTLLVLFLVLSSVRYYLGAGKKESK